MSALEVVPRPLVGAAANPRIIRERVEELLGEGLTRKEVAFALGVRPDSLTRQMRRWGMIESRHVGLPLEQRDQVRRLVEDGVPVTWIAETFGIARIEPDTVWLAEAFERRAAAGHDTNDWRHIWPPIYNDPKLRELHQEFAPKRKRDT